MLKYVPAALLNGPKATANPTLDLVDAVEMSMDDFAEKNSIGSLGIKDLLISFFSDQKVINWT